jgi:hypothetical protein
MPAALIFYLWSLTQATGLLPPQPEVVTGFYFTDSARSEQEITHPVAGALIGLYDADTNLLVDYTYTLNSGRFTLKGPGRGGRFYVVATKDSLSTRRDFEWAPQGTVLLMIRQTKPAFSIGSFLTWAWGKFDYVITSVLGFTLGLAYNSYLDRKKARKSVAVQAGAINALVINLIGLYDELTRSFQEYDDSTGSQTSAIADRCKTGMEEINTAIDEVTALADKTDVEKLYDAYKTPGTNSYAEFREALKAAKSFVESETSSILALPAEQRGERARAFEVLRSCAFLKY